MEAPRHEKGGEGQPEAIEGDANPRHRRRDEPRGRGEAHGDGVVAQQVDGLVARPVAANLEAVEDGERLAREGRVHDKQRHLRELVGLRPAQVVAKARGGRAAAALAERAQQHEQRDDASHERERQRERGEELDVEAEALLGEALSGDDGKELEVEHVEIRNILGEESGPANLREAVDSAEALAVRDEDAKDPSRNGDDLRQATCQPRSLEPADASAQSRARVATTRERTMGRRTQARRLHRD